MNRRIRGHANFVEYVPLCLLLIAIFEFSHLSIHLIHALGLALLIGRILHGYAFSFTACSTFGRVWCVALTYLVLLVAAALCDDHVIGPASLLSSSCLSRRTTAAAR